MEATRISTRLTAFASRSSTAHSGPPDRGLRILVRRRLTNQPATDACCAGTACQRMIGRQRSHQNAPPLTPARATPIPAHHAVPTTAPMSAITRHTVPTPANSPRLCGHLGPRPSSTPRRRTPRRKKGAPIERIARTPNASRNPTPAVPARRQLVWRSIRSAAPARRASRLGTSANARLVGRRRLSSGASFHAIAQCSTDQG